jgi:hypothetical protein
LALAAALGATAVLIGSAGTLRAADQPTHPLARSTPGATAVIDHAPFDRLLKAYVVKSPDGINRVDYPRFRSEGRDALKTYVRDLQRHDPTALGPEEHAAFFINLYNAVTLDAVLDRYPVRSIKEVRLADASGAEQEGPWKAPLAAVAGHKLSLDEIGGGVLRPSLMKRDPRGHYLLNCLSIGCPNLLDEAMTGARLEGQMATAATAFVRHPRGLAVAGGRARASSLFDWYATDFGGPSGVIAHMADVGGAEVAARLAGITAIAEHDYDWALADASR